MSDLVVGLLLLFAITSGVFAVRRLRREQDPGKREQMRLHLLVVAVGMTLALAGMLLARV